MADKCVLGCGEYRVLFMNRCGTSMICDAEDHIEALSFARVLDDTGVAEISVTTSGDSDGKSCCACLGGLRSWIHTGVIFRNGDLVWGPGPITNDLFGSDTNKITVKDISAWLDRRVVHNDYEFIQTDIMEIARQVIIDALEPDDPCDLIGQMQITMGGQLIDLTIEANKQYAGEILRDLAKIGLDYTVLGMSLILAPELRYGPFVTLRDDDFLTEIQVEERGEEMATKWYVNGEAVGGSAGGIDPYYGLIEQLTTEEHIEDEDTANAAAATRMKASNPAPVYINVPDGAAMSPKAPVCFEQLVPGVLVDIALQNNCRPVGVRNVLTALKVTVGNDGSEQVGVTLAPPGELEATVVP